MCDYCGCRNQPEINELSDEHDRLLDLAYELPGLARRGTHADVLTIFDREFGALLDHHTDKEERGLFTQLRASYAADERLDTLVGEHRGIALLVAAVRDGAPGWREALLRLVTDLHHHILDEEVDLFPYAMYELQGAQWERISEVHAGTANRSPVPDRADVGCESPRLTHVVIP